MILDQPMFYILDDVNDPPIPMPLDMGMFGGWMSADHNRGVALDYIGTDIRVSTIFTGINVSPFGPSPMFETMIFGGDHHLKQWRCFTFDDALKQHEYAVSLVGGRS